MFSKLSQDALFSPQHLDPTLLPPGQFQGSESYEEIIKLRDRVVNSLRQKQIIKYLETRSINFYLARESMVKATQKKES
jgi:hypothetical protein